MVFQVSSGHSSTFILCKNVLNLVLAITVLGFIVQSGYKLVVCLPTLRLYSFVVVLVEVGWRVAGGKTTGTSQDSIITGTTKGKPKKSSRIAEFTLVVLWSVGSIVLTHIVTVLFGAYLIENFEETLTFSILVASLAFIRPLVAQGPSALLTLLERLKWEEESEGKCMCVLAGAWLGAAPIPLDWDTPWQVWPLSCSIGALLSEIGASLFFLASGLKFGTLSSRTNKFK